jgi:hypothetical protein
MTKPFYIAAFLLTGLITACKHDKPKPATSDLNKTALTVNGQKDSVLNNPKNNYGNATIPEPCVRCLINAVQIEDHYRQSIKGVPDNNISYVVNWIKADGLAYTIQNKKATNGLRLDVLQKGANSKKLSSFVYDNSLAKLYFVDEKVNSKKIEIKAAENDLKRIRNGCYWGVASSK